MDEPLIENDRCDHSEQLVITGNTNAVRTKHRSSVCGFCERLLGFYDLDLNSRWSSDTFWEIKPNNTQPLTVQMLKREVKKKKRGTAGEDDGLKTSSDIRRRAEPIPLALAASSRRCTELMKCGFP